MRLNQSVEEKTKTRIRNVAEEMFATHGIGGVTTRALAEKAGANMAAVNYHFGGKDNLAIEVFRDVAYRSMKRRLKNLDRIEKTAAESGVRPDLGAVVESFVDAYVNDDDPRTGLLLARLVLKHRVAPNEWTHAIVRENLDRVAERYVIALHDAAPHLTKAEAHWRYHFMIGAILLTLSDGGPDSRLQRLSQGLCDPSERSVLRHELVAFLTSAFLDHPQRETGRNEEVPARATEA
jgi:AcrR family transcriptional regulator